MGNIMSGRARLFSTATSLIVLAGITVPAQAQEVPAERAYIGLEEVVVTARKRVENVQDVPVAVTAISQEVIDRSDLTSIEKIAARTPNLNVGRASNGSGAQITMRGIGSSSSSIGIEQSVATVVDGVYYGQGRTINEGFFDLARVEVLKGPQALFFGKNATAGVISITTADPTEETEFRARVGYEFKSEQGRLDLVGSGPLSNTLGIRVALRGSKMWGGYYRNEAEAFDYPTLDVATFTPGSVRSEPTDRKAPGEEEFLGRVTLKWEPTDQLTASLKASATLNEVNNNSWNYVAYDCPSGFSQLTGKECGPNFVTYQNKMPTELAEGTPYAKSDGSLYNRYRSWQVTGTVNYEWDDIVLTSVTNYNWNSNRFACACDFQSGPAATWATENSSYWALSSEFRVLTTFDSPVNLMAGGLYQKTKRNFEQFLVLGGLFDSSQAPEQRNLAVSKDSATKGETIALFGQVTWAVVPEVELAAGVRYTHETKDSFFQQPYVNAALAGIFRPVNSADGLGNVLADQTFDNWSPEATLTWKPTDDILLYGAYKTAYKSGGFSNGGINSGLSQTPFADLTFDEETAAGFEVGLKSTVLDNQLRLNANLFTYKYKDLQVDFFNSPIFAFQTLTADARTKGFEIGFEFAPRDVQGLNVHGSINYTSAKYTSFGDAPCYAGQSQAEGCNVLVGGSFRQDLGGQRLSVAPKWTGLLGFDYITDLSDDYMIGFGADARYSGSYLASGFGTPFSRQKEYVTLDANLRFGASNEAWEIALIGKNLTNQFYVTGVVDGPSTGGASGGLTPAHADQLGFGTLPRTVMLQLTSKF